MFFVGIDIAKRSHEAAVIQQDGTFALRSFKFPNSTEGFNKLMENLLSVSGSLSDFEFGMEATGHYWLNLYCKLVDAGAVVHVVNPVQSDALRGLYIRKTKNDSKDSFIIADLIRIGRYSETRFQILTLSRLESLPDSVFTLLTAFPTLNVRLFRLLTRFSPNTNSFSRICSVQHP